MGWAHQKRGLCRWSQFWVLFFVLEPFVSFKITHHLPKLIKAFKFKFYSWKRIENSCCFLYFFWMILHIFYHCEIPSVLYYFKFLDFNFSSEWKYKMVETYRTLSITAIDQNLVSQRVFSKFKRLPLQLKCMYINLLFWKYKLRDKVLTNGCELWAFSKERLCVL